MTSSAGAVGDNHPQLSVVGRLYAVVVLLWGFSGLVLIFALSIPFFSLEGFILFILPAILGGLFGILAWNEHDLLYLKE